MEVSCLQGGQSVLLPAYVFLCNNWIIIHTTAGWTNKRQHRQALYRGLLGWWSLHYDSHIVNNNPTDCLAAHWVGLVIWNFGGRSHFVSIIRSPACDNNTPSGGFRPAACECLVWSFSLSQLFCLCKTLEWEQSQSQQFSSTAGSKDAPVVWQLPRWMWC